MRMNTKTPITDSNEMFMWSSRHNQTGGWYWDSETKISKKGFVYSNVCRDLELKLIEAERRINELERKLDSKTP